MEIESIDDVRQYCNDNPYTRLSLSWQDMLCDIDEFGEDWQVSDFIEEMEELQIKHKL